jgi:endo-1,4-beta-xylanase
MNNQKWDFQEIVIGAVRASRCATFMLVFQFLVSCTNTPVAVTASTTPWKSGTFSPTVRMTLPASPTMDVREKATVLREAILYNGPGNTHYDVLRTLPAGTMVSLEGKYGDFLKVGVSADGPETNGYIYYKSIYDDADQVQLPLLSEADVPWKPIYSLDCAPGTYSRENNGVTLIGEPSGFDLGSNVIPLESPLRIKMEELRTTGGWGSIKLYGWRGLQRMDIGANDGRYFLGFRDGATMEYKSVVDDLGIPASQPIEILFNDLEGKSLSVYDKDHLAVRVIDLQKDLALNVPQGLFPGGNVYIGTSIGPHTKMEMIGLTLGTPADGMWSETPDTTPGLADIAATSGISVGTEFILGAMMNKRYCRVMENDFNVAVQSDFSWGIWWTGPDEFDFSLLDQDVDNAVRHGWKVRASHLVWGGAILPDWLLNGDFSREEYMKILETNIKTIVGRYKDKVQEWSIANEAVTRAINGNDFWGQKIGPDYVEMAFRWAREADPDGILIFNDGENERYKNEFSRRVIDRMYDTVSELKARGVPIDVVGMQMHLLGVRGNCGEEAVSEVMETMRKFSDLGVRIYITEFDVNLHNQPGTEEQKLALEADIYRDMMKACVQSNVCDSFTTWGVADSTSWLTCDDIWCPYMYLDASPLLFDMQLNPKPAYFAIKDALRGS